MWCDSFLFHLIFSFFLCQWQIFHEKVVNSIECILVWSFTRNGCRVYGSIEVRWKLLESSFKESVDVHDAHGIRKSCAWSWESMQNVQHPRYKRKIVKILQLYEKIASLFTSYRITFNIDLHYRTQTVTHGSAICVEQVEEERLL